MTKKTHFYWCLLFILVSSIANTVSAFAVTENIQRVRIDFTMPDGYVRHLLLAFTKDNSASDAYNYGYDGINNDNYPYDLNWMIGDLRCTTQGVGAFDDSKRYPLGMIMSNDGNVEIALDELENFDSPIDLFIYDSQFNTYKKINDSNYVANIPKGDYLDRFYLVFKDNSSSTSDSSSNVFAKSLSIDEINLNDTKVSYLKSTKELYINTNNQFIIENIHVYNLSGQELFSLNNVNSKLIKIPLQINQTIYGIVTLETDQGRISKKIVLN